MINRHGQNLFCPFFMDICVKYDKEMICYYCKICYNDKDNE